MARRCADRKLQPLNVYNDIAARTTESKDNPITPDTDAVQVVTLGAGVTKLVDLVPPFDRELQMDLAESVRLVSISGTVAYKETMGTSVNTALAVGDEVTIDSPRNVILQGAGDVEITLYNYGGNGT